MPPLNLLLNIPHEFTAADRAALIAVCPISRSNHRQLNRLVIPNESMAETSKCSLPSSCRVSWMAGPS